MKQFFVILCLLCVMLSAGTPAIKVSGPSMYSAAQEGKAQWLACIWKNGEHTSMVTHLSSPTGKAEDAGILADGKRYNQIGKLPIDGSAFSVLMSFRLTTDQIGKRLAVLFCYCTDQKDKCRLRFAITHKGELEVDYKIEGVEKGTGQGFNAASDPLEWRMDTTYTVLFSTDKDGHLYVYRDGQPVIAQDNAKMSVADLIGRSKQTGVSLLTIGFDPQYEKTFYTPLRAIISQFEVYESMEKPLAQLPVAGQRVKHVVVDGSWSQPFDIREINGELLGTFVRVDEKFYDHAARVRLTRGQDHLLVEMKCPIPAGMRTKNTPGNFWREDRVEFFIRPDLASPKYYQYAATPDGQTYVGCGMSELKTHASTFDVTATPAEYTVKVKIPFSELGMSSLGDGWKMTGNFHRCGPTAGGTSSFVLCSETFHTPDDFIPIIVGSAKAYFSTKFQNLKKTTSTIKLDSDATAELAALEKMIEADGDKPECYQAIENGFAAMDSTLLTLSLNGKVQMVWQPDIWSNRMLFNKLARPLTSLHVRMPRNSKKYVGFAFSNLVPEKYLGQVKLAPEWPLPGKTKLFDNMTDWEDAWRNVRFYEAIVSDDMGGKPCYDALSPLPMGTVLRVPGKDTLPLWMEFSSMGLPAGLHTCKIVFKASRRPVEIIDLTWEIVDIDLDEQQEDSIVYSFLYKRCWEKHENLRKMWVEQGFNILYMEPNYPNLRIYGQTKADGTYVPGDMKPLETYILKGIEAGLDINRMKICFSLNWLFNFGGNPSSKGWPENMTNNLRQWVDFLQKRFGITPERIIFYCADEPNGDIHDPNSSMHKAWIWGKLIRKAVPQCRQMVNPFTWKIDDAFMEAYRLLAEDYDIFEPYRPSLNNPKFLAFIKSLNREIWTYDILMKTSSPDDYRHSHWRNCRDDLSGVTSYWSLDDMAGGDGFDPLDISTPTGRQTRTDYGTAYLDFNLGTYLPGRRLIASNAGWYEMRLARLCKKWISAMPAGQQSPYTSRLNKLLSEGSDGDGRVMDALGDKLLDLAIELKKLK